MRLIVEGDFKVSIRDGGHTIHLSLDAARVLGRELLAVCKQAESAGFGGVKQLLNKSVEDLDLSVRNYNCLKNANIRNVGELVTKSESDMLKNEHFGRKSLNEIKEILSSMGLSFAMKVDDKGRLVKKTLELV